MADALRGASSRTRESGVRIADATEVLTWLRDNRIMAAYPLGETDRQGRPRGDWYINSELPALMSVHRIYHGTNIFAAGSPGGLSAILAVSPRPVDIYFNGADDLVEPLGRYYTFHIRDTMVRMVTTPANFRPVAAAAEPLKADDIDVVNRLYRLGAGGQVTRQQITDGIYHGVWEDGRLIAVAGTHFINIREGIGAVGNVFTHPGYRNRGLAARTTGAVTAALLQRCRDVVLNVSATNPPALAVYRRLGYREFGRFAEAYGARRSRKGLQGALDWLRRKLTPQAGAVPRG